MKIICVGLNYKLHNKEMNRPLFNKDGDPVIFLKPDSAILKDRKPFYIPDFSNEIHHEIEVVVKINRLGKNIPERFSHRYYDEITLGVDFTARDLQNKLKDEGSPWEISKAFDNSAVVGDFIRKDKFGKEIDNLNFRLEKNSVSVQESNTSEMLHSIDKIIAYSSRYFTLKIGDLIYTGTPSGVGAVKVGDHLEGYLEEEKLLDFHVK